MKKIVIFMSMFLLAGSIYAQNEKAFFDHLFKGEYQQAEQFLDNNIDLTLPDVEDFLSKGATMKKLEAFFQLNPVNNYVIKHRGNSKGNQSAYYVVQINSGNKSYRMFTYLNKNTNPPKIIEIRLEAN